MADHAGQALCLQGHDGRAPGRPAPGLPYEFLDYGHHRVPAKLLQLLQEKLDQETQADTILLGYGLCSNSVLGLTSPDKEIIVPRVHDCLSLLLGSRATYDACFAGNPGTYYLSPGWMDYGSDPYKEYLEYEQKYGGSKAKWLLDTIYKDYTRLLSIKTPVGEQERLAAYGRQVAAFMGWQYEEVEGSLEYLTRLAQGPWLPDRFVRARPGGRIEQEPFL